MQRRAADKGGGRGHVPRGVPAQEAVQVPRHHRRLGAREAEERGGVPHCEREEGGQRDLAEREAPEELERLVGE